MVGSSRNAARGTKPAKDPNDRPITMGNENVDLKLVVFKDDGSRRDIPVKPGTYVMGRNESASIRIPIPSVSRSHCELVVTDDTARIRDLGSANGTFHNYNRVENAELNPGDIVGVGDFLMTVQINGEPADLAKPEPPIDQPGSSDESSMMDTPGVGSAPAKKPAPPKADSDDIVDDDITANLSDSDSGSFDLSFLDEDDENPQL